MGRGRGGPAHHPDGSTDPSDADAASALTRQLGDLGRAEDAVQEAALQALDTWSRRGVPPNPRAWLTRTARHRAIDRIRREQVRPRKESEAVARALVVGEAAMAKRLTAPRTDPIPTWSRPRSLRATRWRPATPRPTGMRW